MELLILSYPDSIEEFASAYDLIMYAKNKPTKDPVITKFIFVNTF